MTTEQNARDKETEEARQPKEQLNNCGRQIRSLEEENEDIGKDIEKSRKEVEVYRKRVKQSFEREKGIRGHT